MSKYIESWQSALDQVASWKPRPGMPGNTHQQMLKEVAPPAGVSGGGVKKDDHFEKVKKIKDQINKQKDKVAKFDLGDPKQKTPHALATADLKTMNLKLRDMQSAENEPETDDAGKPNKKKEIKEEPLDEGMKIANLVGQSIAHLGMYVELAEDVRKEYFKTNSQVSMFIKAKADQVKRNVPKLIKELRRPGIWSEQVVKADNAVMFWEDKQLDEALRDMEDYREKSKVLQSIQNDPKQMNDPQMMDAVMKRAQSSGKIRTLLGRLC